jgi:hypothetical protein
VEGFVVFADRSCGDAPSVLTQRGGREPQTPGHGVQRIYGKTGWNLVTGLTNPERDIAGG